MWRDIDPRSLERDRPEPGRGRVGGSADVDSVAISDDPRDVFTRDLDLPRGSSRERVRAITGVSTVGRRCPRPRDSRRVQSGSCE
jgi:hypothetical protein